MSARPDRSAGGGRRPDWAADRRWQAGFLVGSVLGVAATVLGRRAERSARRGLVDWVAVERLAVAQADRAPGRLSPLELRAADAAYRDAMAIVVPRLAAALGTPLPGVVERSSVVDRAGWVHANVTSFQSLISRIERDLLAQVVPPGGGLASAAVAIANRWVTTRQLGFLLGFMGTRVLGQYDLALLSAEAEDGRLLFVEENVRATARSLDVPIGPFRTWIALHETTHAFEFEGHPWLRPYLAERLERQLAMVSGSASTLGRDALRAVGRALRGEASGEHWMELLMTPEQRAIFRETQAVMSLLEGFSDYVMDEVGKGLVPDVERISRLFHERRERRTGFERAVLRLTGMDLKLEQYRRGERFVRAVAEARGRSALDRIWASPLTLPTTAEIDAPRAWIARVLDGAVSGSAAGSATGPLPGVAAGPVR
ncbi:MAG TPA: zinc-dependent metalloprotease [Candidatus Sulfomarinibacteraceae bacterium]|nr:zinc-dependent metalloprotease [Candidatus Sulfomarinibacteraceae bacterium]